MTSDAIDIPAAMMRVRRTIETRIRAADRRERAPAARRKADGALAAYDTAALGRALRPALEWDGRGWRALAAEIGVTSPDLSRVMAGQDISAGKIFAICDWLGVDPRKFYRPVKGKRARFRGPRRVASSASRAAEGQVFHGKCTETGRAPIQAARPSEGPGGGPASGSERGGP